MVIVAPGDTVANSWSGLLCPPPGDLPDPGTEPTSVLSPALAGGSFTTSATWEALSEKAPCLCPVTATTLEMSPLVGAGASPADILRN